VKFFRWVFLILAISFAVVPANRALAIADPSSIELNSITAFQNTSETNDILFLARYDVNYGSIPTETITEAFIFRLMDGVTELAATAPFSFVNSGYDEGAIAIYFSASQVDLGSIVWEDPNYEVRLQGNPSVFASPPIIINSSIIWNSVLTTQSDLQDLVIEISRELEINWAPYTDPDIELVSTNAGGNILTQNGEDYWTNVIPNARLAAPNIFAGRTTIPEVTDRTFTLSYRDQLLQFWDTSSVGAALDGVASVFNTPRTLVTTLGLIAFNIFVIFSMVRANPQAGQIAPLTTAIILPVGALIGLTDLVFAALIAMLATFGTVFILFLRRG
jgi:hypothetical protein